MLKDLPGLRPAPYLASRGLTWIQRTDARTLDDADLFHYLRAKPRPCRREAAKEDPT